MSRRLTAALLDRDGTINVKAPEGDYVTAPEEVQLIAGAAGAIARLNAVGVPVAVITNQRGIALGRMTEEDLRAVHERLATLLERHGARVDAWYHCPHDAGACDCRKPATGMLERAARELGLDSLADAVVIGDSVSDVAAGRAVGAYTIRIGRAGESGDADAVAGSLAAAVEELLR